MQARGFDTLTRRWAAGMTRRRGLLGLAGTALTLIVDGAASPPAAAKACRAPGQSCTEGKVPCCGKTVCQRQICSCRGNQTACDRHCVNTQRHEEHCGRCGRRCRPSERCRQGTCQPRGGGDVGETLCDEVMKRGGCGRRGGTGPYSCEPNADLSGAVLAGCDLSESNLTGVVFTNAVLVGADLSDTLLDNADFREAKLMGAKLNGAIMRSTDFGAADLRDALMREVEMDSLAELQLTNLQRVDFTDANVARTDLSQADMREATLSNANFWVIWSHTICPDGQNSDHHGGTCCGNLNGHTMQSCDSWNGID